MKGNSRKAALVLARAVSLVAITVALVSVLLVAGALLAGCSSTDQNTTALTLATTTTTTTARTTSETPSSGHHPDTTAATFAPMPDTTSGAPTSDTVPIPTTAPAYLPSRMPADFAFTAAYGVVANNLIDTFDGTFTKDIIAAPKPNPTTALRLTRKEMASLYENLVDIGILDYPSDFRPDVEQEAKTGVSRRADPHSTYVLRVRAAACDKYVFWDDVSGSTTHQAKDLRGWFETLRQMIEAKPEYKAMPPAEGGYL